MNSELTSNPPAVGYYTSFSGNTFDHRTEIGLQSDSRLLLNVAVSCYLHDSLPNHYPSQRYSRGDVQLRLLFTR
jgi:hypothetical protein